MPEPDERHRTGQQAEARAHGATELERLLEELELSDEGYERPPLETQRFVPEVF